MISRATVHSTIVLMNRRMNAERGVSSFGPVCSNVAGMRLHDHEGRHAVQDEAVDSEPIGRIPLRALRSGREFARVLSSCYLVILLKACYGFVRDERICGASNRSPTNCHPKSKVGAGSNSVAGVTKSITECHFDRGHVRVCRGGLRARPDFC